MDLIDRRAAIALADSLKDDLPDDKRIADCVMAHNEGILDYQTALSLLPSAQPERMKGRWTPHREKSREYIGATLVYVTYDYWFCDTCGYRVEDGQPLYNFCPNCGADMRGEQDDSV